MSRHAMWTARWYISDCGLRAGQVTVTHLRNLRKRAAPSGTHTRTQAVDQRTGGKYRPFKLRYRTVSFPAGAVGAYGASRSTACSACSVTVRITSLPAPTPSLPSLQADCSSPPPRGSARLPPHCPPQCSARTFSAFFPSPPPLLSRPSARLLICLPASQDVRTNLPVGCSSSSPPFFNKLGIEFETVVTWTPRMLFFLCVCVWGPFRKRVLPVSAVVVVVVGIGMWGCRHMDEPGAGVAQWKAVVSVY